MKKTAMFVLATALVAGCGGKSGPGGPLGVAGAILTAPITAPIMFFEARRNDDRVLHERVEAARRNHSPPPQSTRALGNGPRGHFRPRSREVR